MLKLETVILYISSKLLAHSIDGVDFFVRDFLLNSWVWICCGIAKIDLNIQDETYAAFFVMFEEKRRENKVFVPQ